MRYTLTRMIERLRGIPAESVIQSECSAQLTQGVETEYSGRFRREWNASPAGMLSPIVLPSGNRYYAIYRKWLGKGQTVMITPIGNKILVLPMHRDAIDRQLLAAMRSENAGDFVQKLAEEIAPSDPGRIVLVKTEPPICGRVVAMGKPFCEECRQPISVDIHMGDVVVYHKMSGLEIGVDGVAHILLKPHDVLLIWRPDPVKES